MIKWKKYDEIIWKNEKKNAEKHFKNDQKISSSKKTLKFFNSVVYLVAFTISIHNDIIY